MKNEITNESESFVVAFVERLLDAGQLDLRIRHEREDAVVHLQLHGPDSSLILSNNARVLYSLEHIANQVLFRHGFCDCKVMIDCNGYRSTRMLELQLMARKAAERVKTTRLALPLQPMPAVERRVIHLTLAEDLSVRTESAGIGLNRHVVILPEQ